MSEVKCPKCGKQAHLKRYARVAGVTVGGTLGAANGWLAAAEIAKKIVPMLFKCAGPYVAIIGQAMGALGGAAGGAYSGYKFGQLIDENLIAHYKCNSCGNEFKQ